MVVGDDVGLMFSLLFGAAGFALFPVLSAFDVDAVGAVLGASASARGHHRGVPTGDLPESVAHLLKTFGDGGTNSCPTIVIWTLPSGQTYVTSPGSAILFPALTVDIQRSLRRPLFSAYTLQVGRMGGAAVGEWDGVVDVDTARADHSPETDRSDPGTGQTQPTCRRDIVGSGAAGAGTFSGFSFAVLANPAPWPPSRTEPGI